MSPSVAPNTPPSVHRTPTAPAAVAPVVAAVAAADDWDDDDLLALRQLPKVGDEFLGFELTDELGRGGFGRVFLARQKDLADRPVALKVTVGPDAESQNLARLQHTNIMPIHSVHKTRRMVAVCMPYYGRTTLADLCSSLDALHTPPTSGGHVVGTLAVRRDSTRVGPSSHTDTRSGESAVRPPSGPPPAAEPTLPNLSVLRTMSYVDAVLWIGRRIADGLAHAHDRGIVHRDLKPANVLLADDGQPLVLDFNLSAHVSDRGRRCGGTIPYMAPEQLRAMAGVDATIDPRADVYSLGLILAHLLTGRHPFPRHKGGVRDGLSQIAAGRAGPLPRLRSSGSRAVSPTVEAIVHKCLAFDPADRYQSAHDLAEDLERHQANLPTRHAPNPSLRERLCKWKKRHPKLTCPLPVAGMAAGVAAVAVGGWAVAAVAAERAALARNAERGRAVLAEFDALAGPAEQYLTAHNGNPELLTRGRAAGFHALDTLTAQLGDRWADRPEYQTLLESDRERLTTRAGELASLLSRSGGLDGRDGAFWERVSAAAPASTREPLLRAAGLHADGKFRQSIPDLQSYSRGHPDDAGGWFLLGRAHAEGGSADDAYLAFSAGIALRPRYAAGYFFRAVAADRLKKADPATGLPQALLDADRAVDLDPGFAEGRLLRAQLRHQLKRPKDALADLDAILDQPAPPTRAWLLRAVVREQLGDRTGAAADRADGLKREPATAVDYIARGVARRKADPAAALADFKSAEALDPLNTAALENQAYVQAEILHRPDQAVDTLARLLAVTPHNPLALISRAVYLARSGKTDEAVADAERATALSDTPAVRYRVACVYALAAKADPKHVAPALRHLAAALKAGFGYEYLPTDDDLDPLRGRPEFDRLSELTKLLTALGLAK
jgi:serine/threonine protein kinase/predicted Zn-dependent protease